MNQGCVGVALEPLQDVADRLTLRYAASQGCGRHGGRGRHQQTARYLAVIVAHSGVHVNQALQQQLAQPPPLTQDVTSKSESEQERGGGEGLSKRWQGWVTVTSGFSRIGGGGMSNSKGEFWIIQRLRVAREEEPILVKRGEKAKKGECWCVALDATPLGRNAVRAREGVRMGKKRKRGGRKRGVRAAILTRRTGFACASTCQSCRPRPHLSSCPSRFCR